MYQDVLQNASAVLGAVAGSASVIVIPAPGAAQRIRLVGGHAGAGRAAGTAIDILLTGGVFVHRLGRFGDAATGSCPLVIPGPGVVLPLATALTFTVISTAATGNGVIVVYYYLDDFS